MRILFAGTPEFAVAPLRMLLESSHEVCAVYTQPDRPAGRGRKLQPSPVKSTALAAEIPVLQPASLRDSVEQQRLAAFAADLMVVVAYGLMLPKAVLDAPRLGCINIHASLLPRWRGAAPIQRAIEAGDRETGITLMQMDEGLDTGTMLARAETPIAAADTAAILHDRLTALGAELLMQTLPALENGTLVPQAQDDARATYARKLDKAEARIDWLQPALELDRRIRAFNPWPVAYTEYEGQPLRIWSASVAAGEGSAAPGTVLAAGSEGIDVATGAGVLRILELQPAGSRRMPAAAFVNARDLTHANFAGPR